MTLQLGWFSTGRGEGSRSLLRMVQQRIQSRELDARIQFVFSNREPGEHEGSDRYFDLVRTYGLPLVTHSSRRFRQRAGGALADHRQEYDQEMLRLLEGFSPEVCVLAGYMLIVSPLLCNTYTMINLHPALPQGPKGTWQEVIWSLVEHRARETGAMVHLVTEELDRGPVLTYFSMPLRGPLFDQQWEALSTRSVEEIKATEGEDFTLFQRIREEERRREPYLLLETLKVLAKGQVRIDGGRVVDGKGRPLKGFCLNEAIEEAL